MEVAWWPKSSSKSLASYRLRCAQVVDALNSRGISAGLFRPKYPPKILVLSKRYDIESIRLAQQLKMKHGTKLVLDLCDNHFFAISDDPRWAYRAESLSLAIRTVDMVVVSSESLGEIVMEKTVINSDKVVVIEDAAETPFNPSMLKKACFLRAEHQLKNLNDFLSAYPFGAGCRLVWFGNHGSDYANGGMRDLTRIKARLHAIAEQKPISLTVVSNSRETYQQVFNEWKLKTHYCEWHKNTFSRVLRAHDVALIPIESNPFTICKTNNRVATSLLHGLGVVADEIPSYLPLKDGVVLNDWEGGLSQMLDDVKFREERKNIGRKLIEKKWNLDVICDEWIKLFLNFIGPK